MLRRRVLSVAAFLGLTLVAAAAHAVIVRTAVGYRPVYHPVARTAAVVGTAVAVGAVVSTLPPTCTSVLVGNVAYQHCGPTWYRPAYTGTTVNYTVVNPPR